MNLTPLREGEVFFVGVAESPLRPTDGPQTEVLRGLLFRTACTNRAALRHYCNGATEVDSDWQNGGIRSEAENQRLEPLAGLGECQVRLDTDW